MDGRLEISERDFNKCDELLREMPSYVADWYIYLRSSGTLAKTCKDYINKVSSYLLSISPDSREIKPSELTAASVRQFLISKQKICDRNGNVRPSSKSYQQCLWSCLYNFFTYLSDENIIEGGNPIKKNSRPTGNDLQRINEHRVLLTKDDFNKILESVESGCGTHKAQTFQGKTKDRDEAIMRLFMCTGLRESALTSLNISNIDFENGTLFVLDKGDVPHKFQLTSMCMESIERSLRDRIWKENEPLFLSLKGNRMHENTIAALVKKYTEDALGKALSPHKLRSGVCSILYSETADIEFVRRFIGHSDSVVTKRYIVTDGEELEKGNKIFTRLIG